MSFEIRHEVGVTSAPEEIYQALTEIKKLSQWWTSDTRGNAQLGGILEFWFGEFCQKFKVIELKTNKLVRWKALSESANEEDEWANTEISFTLIKEENQCMIQFKHSGWRDNNEAFPHCSTKWAIFMLSLKDLLEKGKGKPFPNDTSINHY